MMTLTCGCGHAGPAESFIESSQNPFTGQVKDSAWWRCPACRARFRGPKSLLEIGVQVIEADGKRKEIPPADPGQASFRKWLRRQKIEEMKNRPGQLKLVDAGE